MTARISRRIVLAARPRGLPRPDDFRIESAPVAPPAEGQLLLAVETLSIDPYMRGRMDERQSYTAPTPLGGVMGGEAIGRVIESRHPDFAIGDRVLCGSGWQTLFVANAGAITRIDPRCTPLTTALGVLGMPGFTAWIGLAEIGRPQPGETLVVAAATGPVGSLVGQIARQRGARVVGIAGGPRKCAWMQAELGFDAVIDHRGPELGIRLREACPDGIDVYFENVGGRIWLAVKPLLNRFARVPVCGLVAHYNDVVDEAAQGGTEDRMPRLMRDVLTKSLTIRGYIQRDFANRRGEFLDEISAWLAAGSIRYREDIVEGLDAVPKAFIGMLEGQNFGKLLARVG